MKRLAAACVLALAAANAPGDTAVTFDARELRAILRLSPLPPPPRDPSNAVADSPRAAKLGERLFFDARLSTNGATACATCHDPARAWTDGKRSADGGARFARNTPSVRNTAHNRWFYWDGRADSAWAQALGPLENAREMGGNRLAQIRLVAGDARLAADYAAVFGALPDGIADPRRFPPAARPVVEDAADPLDAAWRAMREGDRRAANRMFANLGKAIAAFERGITVGETPFDRYVVRLRQGDSAPTREFPITAQRGLKLFVGRGECTLCHSGATLSDGEFHDVGIALGTNHRVDPGRHRGVLTLLASGFTRAGDYADTATPDAPVRYLVPQSDQLGQFKTPTLRGVADTAPYMHDGRFDTLEQVVRFYSTREGASPLGHPTTLLKPLGLSDVEVGDLVAFLRALGGVE